MTAHDEQREVLERSPRADALDPLAELPPRGDKIMAPADVRVGPMIRAEAWQERADAAEAVARHYRAELDALLRVIERGNTVAVPMLAWGEIEKKAARLARGETP